MIDGVKDGLSMDCPICSRELFKREVLDAGDGQMVLVSYVCPGTGMDCSLVSVMVWENTPVGCEHSDSAYSLMADQKHESCGYCGNVREIR